MRFFEFYWDIDRQGERRLKKRTDRKELRASLRSFTEWVKRHRHYSLKRLFGEFCSKLRGYFNYYGAAGNSRLVKTLFDETMRILFKWLNRRSRKHRMNGWRFYRLLDLFHVPVPRITELNRRPNPVLA